MSNRRLGFDITDADTIDDSDNVGAFLRSSAGLLLTSTTIGPVEALDVNVANAITIDIDGVYDVSTNPDPDNAGVIVHVRAATPADADQTKRTTGAAASSDAVVAANAHGLDTNAFGMGYNGTTWDRLRTHAATGQLAVADTAGALKATTQTVGTSSSQIAATSLANRKKIKVQNLSSRDIYLGEATGVTTATGIQVAARGETEWIPCNATATLWAIGDAAALNVRVMEAA